MPLLDLVPLCPGFETSAGRYRWMNPMKTSLRVLVGAKCNLVVENRH